MEKYYLLNMGCAKNQVEGELLAGLLLEQGLLCAAEPQEAGLLVINTCGFIKSAVQENIQAILELAQAKRPDQRLVVVGCLVGRYGRKLARSLPEVDLFVGPGETPRLLEHLAGPPSDRLAISAPRAILENHATRAVSTGPGWAYLRVGDGCEHKCAFCTIPRIRGSLRSRPMARVVEEAKRLVDSGVVEINLVAQDLCSYGKDLPSGASLASLLEALAGIGTLQWVRLLYLSPDSLEKNLLEAIAGLPQVLPYLDIPLQHIADKVLAAMGRGRRGAQIIELLDLARAMIPGLAMRTTLLVGHPGEGEEEFTELLKFVQDYRFDHLGCFAYQAEAGTRSSRMEAPSAKLGNARRGAILRAQKAISKQKLREKVGQELDLLVLGPHPESPLLGVGRLASQAPEVDGEVIITDGQAQPGAIARCRVTKAHAYDLEAVLLES